MRISSALFLLALSACGERTADQATLANYEAQAKADNADNGRLVCAQGRDGVFGRVCTMDREESGHGLILTIRHPGGAFRRLLVTKDGRGVIAADGAETATVTILGNQEIEVALGGDRYRLPATIKGKTPAS